MPDAPCQRSKGFVRMQIGFVGLGKMGLNMVTRLVRGGHDVVAFDRNPGHGAARERRPAPHRPRRSRR
ncbi:MAG: NAD(P)-binding domain-containing protein [Vicinamibacterales bacterium]